jgi:hypothetical protein
MTFRAIPTTVETIGGVVTFLSRGDGEDRRGDRVEVQGSRIGSGTETAIIAGEVRKGDETLSLRNEAGVPAWSGARRR